MVPWLEIIKLIRHSTTDSNEAGGAMLVNVVNEYKPWL